MNSLIPTLLRPKLFAARNRWRGHAASRQQIIRDIVLCFFGLFVMGSIYLGTLEGLQKIQSFVKLAYLPPNIPLGLILLVLTAMLVISNGVAALGSLYLSRDLDLILASPISPRRFFFGRALDIFVSSSWMVLIFAAPVILAFGAAYDAPLAYYGAAALVAIPFLVLPLGLGIIAVSLFTAIVPANRTREVLISILVMSLGVVYLLIDLIGPSTEVFNNVDEILRILALIALPNKAWLPSSWAAAALGEFLAPAGRPVGIHLGLLFAAAGGSFSLAYIVVRLVHPYASSRARSGRGGITLRSKRSQTWLRRCTPFVPPQHRAVFGKELKVFSRDLAQALQLCLLIGLCMLYLYNFRILHSVRGLPDVTQLWWNAFLVLANLGMGAFVVSAICTRFVFPSVSLEGQSWWVVQTAPIEIGAVLRAKFWCWYIPVTIVAGVIFAAGACAIGASPRIVIITTLTSAVICYGIVGVAVGLGAVFANFQWEHTSQLAASFGSLVFMLVSTMLIFLDIAPAMVLVFIRTLRSFGYSFSPLEWYTAITTSAALLVYINYAAARAAFRAGERALAADRAH